ncbi:hypothetical protein BH11ACT6_BH11ACT6_12740 [soil metagenome]
MMVHAHPDDESSLTGGTLARYAAAGCRTVLVTCTDGGQGDAGPNLKPGQPGHDPRLVAAQRSQELAQAAALLGVHDVIKLGYPDSGVSARPAPDSFSQRPVRPMLVRLVRLIRMYQPDVVITYPPNGMSGHPDHIRTHDLVLAAHQNIIANSEPAHHQPQDAASASWGPQLYYIALSRTRLRAAQDRARVAFGPQSWVPPDGMAVDDASITTSIDVAAFRADKLAALAAHASQADAAALLQIFGAAADSAESVEEYVRVYPVPPSPSIAVEVDFFGSAVVDRTSAATA